MPTYPHNITTIHQKYNVPAVLGTINLNKQIQAGVELDPEHLKHAQSTATTLRGLLDVGIHPELNEAELEFSVTRSKSFGLKSKSFMMRFEVNIADGHVPQGGLCIMAV